MKTKTCKNFVVVWIVIAVIASIDANAQDYVAWTWNTNLPAKVSVTIAPTNRTSAAVEKLFKEMLERGKPPPRMAVVLAGLGRPDAFSPQFMYSWKLGTAEPSRSGGTMRFVLSDGGAVHVYSSDFTQVGLAIRYDKKGKGELLYK